MHKNAFPLGLKAMRFLIADAHPLVRCALTLILRRLVTEAEVDEAETRADLLARLRQAPPYTLVIIDLHLPDSRGLETLLALQGEAPTQRVAVLSGDETPATILAALERGAAGYLPKSLSEDVIQAALGLILAGGTYVPGAIALLSSPPTGAVRWTAPLGRSGATSDGGPPPSLTRRQQEVFNLVVEGLSNKEIASRLNLAEATIKVHITAILRACGVNSRAKAIRQVSEGRGQRTEGR